MNTTPEEMSAREQIDAIIEANNDWRGTMLADLRAVILKTDIDIVEEVKWKKPSKPSGVPVWSHNGILCVADILKSAVRLTFPKGAKLNDPENLFNARLDNASAHAIDFFEGVTINETALKALMLEAARFNAS